STWGDSYKDFYDPNYLSDTDLALKANKGAWDISEDEKEDEAYVRQAAKREMAPKKKRTYPAKSKV
ncbi:unnamed protein product, partial [Chrysoparadoxa australica]